MISSYEVTQAKVYLLLKGYKQMEDNATSASYLEQYLPILLEIFMPLSIV